MNTFTRRITAAFALATTLSAAIAAQAPKKDTLYKRIGGYDAIAAVTDDFVPRLVTDPQLAKYLTGAGDDTKMHIRRIAVDFICFATGGPCVYIGRPMKTAHAVAGEERAGAAVDAVKADIVEKK